MSFSRRHLCALATTLPLLSGLAACGANPDDASGNYPTGPVEFLVQTGPGGGSDIFARQVAAIIKNHDLVSRPLVVVNKDGGSGAVAIEYLERKMDDDHLIFAVPGAGLLTNVARGKIEFDDLKQVAILGLESNVVVTSASSPYQTLDDLISEAKTAEDAVTLAGAAIGGGGHLAGVLLGNSAGVRFNFVSFESGGEALVSVLSGDSDFAIESPGEAAELARAGKVRILATMTEERLPELPDVATAAELGYDATFQIARGVAVSAETPDAVVEYWEQVFKDIAATEDWTTFADESGASNEFFDAEKSEAFFKDQYELMKPTLDQVIEAEQ